MNKEKILKEIALASSAGNIEEVLALTELLNKTPVVKDEAEPPKRKRGRPKKSEQEKVVIIEDEPEVEEVEDADDDEIDDYEIEDDDDEEEDEPVEPKRKKSKKKDSFLAQFEVKQKPTTEKNTGVRLSWKKPKKIEFIDFTDEYRADVIIDKKLKVQENVPRDRPKVSKKKVPCCICGEKFSTYSNNINYMFDEEKRKTVMVPMRCNNCYGEK